MPFLIYSSRSNSIVQPAPILRSRKGDYLFYSSKARVVSLRRLLVIQRTSVSHTWFGVLFWLLWKLSPNGHSGVHKVGAQEVLAGLTFTWIC